MYISIRLSSFNSRASLAASSANTVSIAEYCAESSIGMYSKIGPLGNSSASAFLSQMSTDLQAWLSKNRCLQ